MTDPGQLGNVVVKTLPNGTIVRLRDVASTALGAQNYGTYGLQDLHPAAVIVLLQSPGSNALEAGRGLRATIAALARTFPPDLTYSIAFDTTSFITAALGDV